MSAAGPGGNRDDIERKLSAARTQLVIEKPFLGVLVLHLPLAAADPAWCRTIGTDAQTIYYNPDYIERLNVEQTKFLLAHETLHCALSHFHRREHRAKHRWDVACDYAVNAILVADGLLPPPDALISRACAGLSAEEIYPSIKDDAAEPIDQHLYDGDESSAAAHGGTGPHRPSGTPPVGLPPGLAGFGADPQRGDASEASNGGADAATAPPPLSADVRERLAVQWQLRLAAAAQQALRAGKLAGSTARLIDDLLQPQLPWRMLLARYVTSIARTDYSFARPSRREGPALLPGLRAAYADIAIVVDTSGSIDPEEMHEFISEIDAIKGQLNARITLHACDARLDPEGPWTYEPWDPLRLPKQFTGGGGTRFIPAFDWAERLDRRPDLLVYFTDAEGEFPPRAPEFPVLWLVKGKAGVPWGQRVQLN
jgi:predicted metal-dependent peptidase